MTQLTLQEIQPGLVSHLDQTMLSKDRAVLDTYPQKDTELRPFVCVAVEGDQSTWSPLTSTYRRERLKVEDDWRHGGIDMWRDRVCYLNDGANVYIGPTTSFIAASAEELTDEATRSRMAAEGVVAIAKEIERQKRRRINGRDV